MVLIAESTADLQAMLDESIVFCRNNMMTVNIKKSEVVIFNSLSRDYKFTYDGHVLYIKDKFIYLGMLSEGRHDVKQMARRRLNRGRNDSNIIANVLNLIYTMLVCLYKASFNCYTGFTNFTPIINNGFHLLLIMGVKFGHHLFYQRAKVGQI